MNTSLSSESIGRWEMLLSSVFFGTIGFVTKYIDLPSVLIVTLRGAVAVLFLLALVKILKKPISRDDIYSNMFLLVIGGLCQALNWYFLFQSYSLTLLSTSVICYNMGPVMLLVITPLLLKEKLTASSIICVLLATVGVLLVSGIATSQMPTGDDLAGIISALIAAVFEISVIIVNKKLRSITAIDRTVFQMLVASVVLAAISMVTVDFGTVSLDMPTVLMIVYLGVFATAIAFTLYFAGISRIKSQSVAIFLFIEPALALLLSVAILGEPVDIYGAVGMVLVLGSTLVSQMIDSMRAKSGSKGSA